MTFRFFAIACAILLAPHAQTIAAKIDKPPIVSKVTWSKVKPKSAEFEVFGKVTRQIIIHHTADGIDAVGAAKARTSRAKKSAAARAADYQALHRKNLRKFGVFKGKNWPDIAYHYYITAQGDIVEGRSTDYKGDSGTNYDMTGKVLVVLEGNFEFLEPTEEQKKSMTLLVAWLAQNRNVPPALITGHRDQKDLAGKKGLISICPGKNLYAYLPQLRKDVAAKLAQ